MDSLSPFDEDFPPLVVEVEAVLFRCPDDLLEEALPPTEEALVPLAALDDGRVRLLLAVITADVKPLPKVVLTVPNTKNERARNTSKVK